MIPEEHWAALRTEGMAAYERLLRLLHAEQIELADRLARLEAQR